MTQPLAWRYVDQEGNISCAHSDENRVRYLVWRDDYATTVRLCRVPESLPIHEPLAEAREALRTEVILVAPRGPGRPPGGPEMRDLVTRAMQYAERYDRGEDLEFGGWQHATEQVRRPAAADYPGPGKPCPHEGGKISPSFRCAYCARRDAEVAAAS